MNTQHAWKREQQYAPLIDARQRSALMRTQFFTGYIALVRGQKLIKRIARMHLDVFLN